MLSRVTQDMFRSIIAEAYALVSKYVEPNDLTGNINFAAIFAHNLVEFDKYLDDIRKNGKIFEKQPTGDYYVLDEPLITEFGNITVCRVRKPAPDALEQGYADFETTEFSAFKQKYLGRKYFREITNVLGIGLIELRNPEFSVRAYFPQTFDAS